MACETGIVRQTVSSLVWRSEKYLPEFLVTRSKRTKLNKCPEKEIGQQDKLEGTECRGQIKENYCLACFPTKPEI